MRIDEVVVAYRAGERVKTNAATFKGLESAIVVLCLDLRKHEDLEALNRKPSPATTLA